MVLDSIDNDSENSLGALKELAGCAVLRVGMRCALLHRVCVCVCMWM